MWKSHEYMLCLWTGCAVMGTVYLFCMWNGDDSPAFIVGQIVMSILGIQRELYLKKSVIK